MANTRIEVGIYLKPNGRYLVRTTAVDPETGKLRQVRRTVDTIQEARDVRDEIKDEIHQTPAGGDLTTLADYAERWLASKADQLKPSTLRNYTDALAAYILPELGHLPCEDVTRQTLLRWVAWAELQRQEDGSRYAHDTVGGWWRVLKVLVRDAIADGVIEGDPLRRVRAPRGERTPQRELRTLTSEQLANLVRAAQRSCPDRYAEIVTLAYTGMRAGELYALRWEDVDHRAGKITVCQAVYRAKVGTTKTGAAREVPLPRVVSEAIEEHRREMMRAQHPGLALGVVFPSDAGTYRTSSSLHKPLALAAEMAGIDVRVTPQVLRRTLNTLLVAAGVDRIVIRANMGHSSEEMTERYAGVPLAQKAAALATLLATPSGTCHPEGS